MKKALPTFLKVKKNDVVLIQESSLDLWIGTVINIIGSAKNSKINSIFQVYNNETGQIKTINADLICKIIEDKAKNQI